MLLAKYLLTLPTCRVMNVDVGDVGDVGQFDLASVIWMTSAIHPHPTTVITPFALIIFIVPRRQSVPWCLLLKTWPMFLSCLCQFVAIKDLVLSAVCKFCCLVLLLVHGTLFVLPNNNIMETVQKPGKNRCPYIACSTQGPAKPLLLQQGT